MWARAKQLPLAAWILIGLALGAIVGLALPAAGSNESVDEAVGALSLIGQLWLQALQMTILPLVFAMLSTLFIRSKGVASGGRTTRRALVAIFGLYTMGALLGVVMNIAMFNMFPVTDGMAQALRAMSGEGMVAESPPWGEAVLALVPANIVAAMSGDSLLPVLFFALIFGAALAKLEDGEGKRTLVSALTALADTVFIIVNWILKIAPLGVAMLILPTTQRHGTDIFAGLAHYISFSVVQVLVLMVVVYVITVTLGRVPLGRFATAIFPAQSVAFGTQSSTGTMPVTITSCRKMGLSDEAISATMPLAAVLLRIASPTTAILVCMYAVAVYDMEPLTVAMIVGLGFMGILIEMSFVGIPGAATFIAYYAPFAAVVGFPIEFVVVLLVVNVIPDIVMTVLHVTSHATATALVDRGVEPKVDTPIEAMIDA
ncbi:cation:dicarboxylase symporter family transporter [Aurantiacibacter sp. MUD11]|uniref:dicarboxylate/amino acid:cation symporter n=1 Tax=Aurantiacibacter sp. MUD11 TaxID=3003265 RepID=UPI0022AAD267|nr:cation:dicarboxylase symporter family transporter [Aurantiacibacter sp. MUD11]WAT17601.1 cation:dicarboxylase symporter family transporter [Aurantiacibacter sp. MUD11]